MVDGDADAPTLVELSETTFSEFLHGLLTANGALRTGRARLVQGALEGVATLGAGDPDAAQRHAHLHRRSEGNGDLNWHTDDGIGGHPVMCPLIQVGVQLDVASPANGQLLLLAGSHRYTKHWISWEEEGALPTVALETRPGDVTVHYGDTMHSTPAPTSPDHYNDALFRPEASGRVASRAATY